MDFLNGNAVFFKIANRRIAVVLVALFSITISQASMAQIIMGDETNCGQPDFSRFTDRGVFVWQNCGSGDWSLRTTNGGQGDELATEGRLTSSSEVMDFEGFNLDPGPSGMQDLVDSSDLTDIDFRLRVFNVAQDGFNFRLDEEATTCLFVRNSADVPVVVGRNNIEFSAPFNLQTLTPSRCVPLTPIISLIIEDDDIAMGDGTPPM